MADEGNKFFSFSINSDQIMSTLKNQSAQVEQDLAESAAKLAQMARSKIVELANHDLQGWHRETFMGPGGSNIKLTEAGKNIYVVEIDESVMGYDRGLPRRSMLTDKWLLKNAKTAKDGCVLNPRNKVLTSLGWKKIKDIVPGDMVLTHSGKYREVKKLLIQEAGMGTEYVNFKIKSYDNSHGTRESHKEYSDLTCPLLSLTPDHLVLTPNGWVAAGNLKKGDLIASPGDLKKLCKECGAPIPINVKKYDFCLNNSCARKWSTKQGIMPLGRLTPEQRRKNGKLGNDAARASGCFDQPNWGARNPETLQKLRTASAAAMREKISTGEWAPEIFFEECLKEQGIEFVREKSIQTDRVVNAGNGNTRLSTMFFDFFIPSLNLVIELDGAKWHTQPDNIERDAAKDAACKRDGIRMVRIPSHRIYRRGKRLARFLKLWTKNHSGELGISWVKIEKVRRGVVNRKDHVYSKKYDICLDAEEHSFCCETVFIHNSKYTVIPFKHDLRGGSHEGDSALNAQARAAVQAARTPDNKRINLKAIEKNPDGTPRIGLLHKINVTPPFSQKQAPHLFSKPRSAEDAAKTGLQQHEGIYKLQGLAISQRMVGNKVKREAVTFRVASSKQASEDRWMAPAIAPGKFLERTVQWMSQEAWPQILQELQSRYS